VPRIRPELSFATPRKLPRAKELKGRVAVLDVAFASEASGGGFDKVTRPLIEGLGTRLAVWVDHHDHLLHAQYAVDPRFVLSTKKEHGACPEMITPELVARVGDVDTIVCHVDFDGLCSAAKWMRDGAEPYPGADDDARAVDTRIGVPGPIATRIDRAIRARNRDQALLGLIVRHLASGLSDRSLWSEIDKAGSELAVSEDEARRLAGGYVHLDLEAARRPPYCRDIALLDLRATPAATGEVPTRPRYDRTLLLLLGQERARCAVLVDGETMTLAAPFDSGANFLELLGLSGGMPTLVSVNASRLGEVLEKIGVSDADRRRFVTS
jgi:hypothetical protein